MRKTAATAGSDRPVGDRRDGVAGISRRPVGRGTGALVPFVPYLVISIVHCVLIVFHLPGRGFETKQLLMPALALAVVWALWRVRPWPRGAALLLLGGIAASWVGDGAGLFFPTLPTLPMMILWFAIAHICYIVLFWRAPGIAGVRRGLPWWTLIYAVWWIVTLLVVGPHSGDLLLALAVYGVVLGGTAALSTRLGSIVAWGGAFFLFSDTSLALREFVGLPGWASDLLVMPAYTLGQGLIAYGVVAAILVSRTATASAPTVTTARVSPDR